MPDTPSTGAAIPERSETATYFSLPTEFDVERYRNTNPDLASFTVEQLVQHYSGHGALEGRTCSAITGRESFVSLVPDSEPVLEIGPFNSPCLAGDHVKYFDVMDAESLTKRALRHGLSAARIPERIHYVSKTASLLEVKDKFYAALSSHMVEHAPDLISHLQAVAALLKPGGRYFVICPDKRFCFDQTLANSNIGEILQAYFEKRKVHALASIVEHRALATHNEPARHWKGDSPRRLLDPAIVQAAVDEWQTSNGSYVDVHAWQFTPDSFREILTCLWQMGLIALRPSRIYGSLRDGVEFYAVLESDHSNGTSQI
jgi:hypothetical protein